MTDTTAPAPTGAHDDKRRRLLRSGATVAATQEGAQ